MKKTLASLLFSGLLLANAATVSAQSNAIADHVIKPAFEGTISFAMQIPMLGDDKLDMKCNIKGERTMTEMDLGMQGNMHMYTDQTTKKMTIVMDAMKMGFTMDILDEASSAKVDEKEFNWKATGKKETINGYAAEEYTATLDEGTSADFWLTGDAPKELRDAMRSAMGHMQQKTSPKQAKLHQLIADKGLMPVRTVMSKGDEKLATIDFVKFEKKSLDDALFVPSKDIKFQAMPKGMQGGVD